ncbi:hypothetical protein NBRC3299_0229 [Acetobacter pasteurianus NBRC 3299]|nr:hypothetical protein BBA71_01960 [Acetobacter pasteurianus]GCD73937.1 hypothetical protein NBRC3299_0229 [Acetobacter pasteurianus NBRC 3299]
MSEKTPQYWMENTSKSDIPFARIFDLFDDNETIPSAQNKSADVGVELRYFTEEMPEQMAEDGECLNAEYLVQVEKPSWVFSDGWKLLSAWDNEDGEIVLCYGREMVTP